MAESDTQLEHFTPQHLENDPLLSAPINEQMSDHDMLLHHVTQHDPELYAMDCCLSDMFGI
ncbi:MAG: hypothetical protein SNH55_06310 [Rikenellaceae bacterium]